MPTRLSRLFSVLLALGFVLGAGGAVLAQAQVTADDLNQLTWRWVGPVNFSGRISEFAVPPGQTTTYYVLAASGGAWKTEDAGTHFEPIFDKYGNMSMGSLAVAPSNPNILYVGTGEPMHARSSSHGNGVWKSTDAGKTWTHVGLEQSYFINKVQVDPKNPDVVYVAAEGKLYDNAMDCERGFYKTADGGKTWERAWPLNDRGVGDFVVDPRDFNVVIAQAYKTYRRACTFIDRQAGNALYNAAARKVYAGKKEIIDATNEIDALVKREAPKADSSEAKGRSQVVNRHVLEVLYAGVLRNQEPVKRSGVVYRSDDLGETWKKMTEYKLTGGSGLINQTEAGYYARIYVDAQNDQTVYCCDTNTTVSNDGGKTFKVTGWDSGAYKLHVDHRALWLDPQNSNHIMSGNDGGAGETWDGGKHWSQKATVSAQQFYDVSADNELPYNVMGGTQDNGAWWGPSQNRNSWGVHAADWNYLPTGDAYYVVRDWWDPDYMYYESQFGASSRINLGTGEISGLAKRTSAEELAKGMPAQRYQWNAPIVLSPHNPGIVYICSQFVHRSLSRGERDTFVTISPDLTRADKTRLEEAKKTNLQYATVYTFAESAKKPGLFWAGTDDGNVQMSPDGGVTWTNITANFYDIKTGKAKTGFKGALIPFDRWVKRVVPSRFDENTCYVAFSGYRTHNEDKTWVYVTRDLGKTWEDLSGGMMNPVFDLEEDPDNANVLYLGTDYGGFETIDKGKAWTAYSTSAPNVVIRDLAVQKRDRDLVIGTNGRGIYIADIAPLKEMNADNLAKDAYLFDPEEVVRWNRYERRGEQYGEFAKVDNPAIGSTLYYYLKGEPKAVKLIIKDLEGTLIQELAGNAKKGLQKASWNLTKRADPAPQGAGPGGGGMRRGGRINRVDSGVYKVTLNVDGKDIATKTIKVSPDPLFK